MAAPQRIMRIRRQYNRWVADQSLEDYALRFTGYRARRWSHMRVANTAIGSISFLALEAIGGILTLQFGFTNAVAAIGVVSALIFLSSLIVAYYAATYGLDIDLLTRGAGFGYLGSALSSLIYAIFTFVFFAIEAAIMAVALEEGFGLPLNVGYTLSSLLIIPIVAFGIKLVSRLQLWTQPVWMLLQIAPFAFIVWRAPGAFGNWVGYAGAAGGNGFSLALFGAAASVVFSLMGQIGEQVDFLRFMPPRRRKGIDWRWWTAVIVGGPGWICVGAAKMLAGSFLSVLAMRSGLAASEAIEPVEMYRLGFGYVFTSPSAALAVTVAFVVLSQIKINATNAYAGSIAWSNFFARLTHFHPGRVIWLVFNVALAILIMQLGVYHALGVILGVYSNLAVAWIGTLVADLAINKPLGLSPKGIEFKRAHLPDTNPVGSGAMAFASALALLAYFGLLGPTFASLAGFLGLAGALLATPALAVLTRGRHYLARPPTLVSESATRHTCCICEYEFDREDMASCPAYEGPICSLCCTLDARCGDRCKPGSTFFVHTDESGEAAGSARLRSRPVQYAIVFASLALLIVFTLGVVHLQAQLAHPDQAELIWTVAYNTFWALILAASVSAWMIVLARESRFMAQEESERQTVLLMEEIDAHRKTDAALQGSNVELTRAKEIAEAANLAKSRYIIGMSHELRSPLNAVLGYAQLLSNDASIPAHRHNAIHVVRRGAEHMSGLIDGLLDISKMEAGRLHLRREELDIRDILEQTADMFRIQAETRGIAFEFGMSDDLPHTVYGDGRRLRQILINLLSNAVKYTERGRVSFHVRYRNMLAEIEVRDTGIGIHPEDGERIFEPFERGRGDAVAVVAGTGLGLTITKLLVNIMGGDIKLVSTLGEGSAFCVRLLLSPAGAGRRSMKPIGTIVGYAGPRRSILIADDDADHCAVLSEFFETLGFRVRVARNGIVCLEFARQEAPDLAILDVAMPGISGWSVAETLRREVSPTSQILILSGNASETDARHEAVSYHDAIHTKPFIVDSLLQTVGTLLNLEWTIGTSQPPAGSTAPAEPSSATVQGDLPALTDLVALRQLGEIGYIRGIRDKLADLSEAPGDHRWLVERLEPFVQSLDFPNYLDALDRLIEAGARR